MRILSNLLKWRGVERATPEVSKRFLEQTIARDEEVRLVVEKTTIKRDANHLGPKMHRALGGY